MAADGHNYGFYEMRGACVEVNVPANGYINARGDDWRCDRGYRKEGDECTQAPRIS